MSPFAYMDPAAAAASFCFLVALFFLGLWKYYDRRDFQLFETERRKITFLCIRCDTLYTQGGRAETGKCPRCHFENARLRF